MNTFRAYLLSLIYSQCVNDVTLALLGATQTRISMVTFVAAHEGADSDAYKLTKQIKITPDENNVYHSFLVGRMPLYAGKAIHRSRWFG